MSRIFLRLVALTLILCLTASLAGAEALRGYQKEKPQYQYVQLGIYPTEADGTVRPVLWRVLNTDGSQALLLSELILDVQQVIFCDDLKAAQDTHDFRRITDFADSDLCPWMNSVMLTTLLGGDPMLDALVETHYGKLYPPTLETMTDPANGFPKAVYSETGFKERRAVATPYARQVVLYPQWKQQKPDVKDTLYVFRDYDTSPYWVIGFQSMSPSNVKLNLCGYDGHVSYGVYTRVNVGIRAALALDLSLCHIESGTGTQEDPFIFSVNSAVE